MSAPPPPFREAPSHLHDTTITRETVHSATCCLAACLLCNVLFLLCVCARARVCGACGVRTSACASKEFRVSATVTLGLSSLLRLCLSSVCLQIFDATDGHVLRTIGEYGEQLGQLSYPYGVGILPEGGYVVSEYLNHRLQVCFVGKPWRRSRFSRIALEPEKVSLSVRPWRCLWPTLYLRMYPSVYISVHYRECGSVSHCRQTHCYNYNYNCHNYKLYSYSDNLL